MNFDLNPSNYTLNEMVDLFKLPNGNFTQADVLSKENILVQKIQQDQKINDLEKKNILIFLKTIKEKLVESLTVPTTSLLYEDAHQKVIEESKALFMPAYPSNIYAGIINPLKRRTYTKNVNIDTRFRKQYDTTVSTNFRFELPFVLNKVLNMHLRTFEFPSSSHNICADLGNNFFSINSMMVFIPDGFYNLVSLVDTINLQLRNLYFENIEFIVVLNKVEINITTNQEITIDFETMKEVQTPYMMKLGWVLGFRKKKYAGLERFQAETVADLITLKYCFLSINDYNNNTVNDAFVSALNESFLNNNILARISAPTSMITSDVSQLCLVSPAREYFGPVTINALHIQLLDPYGRVLNLHNLDFSFCLSFEILYDL
jgi:hypothetical protein